MADYQKAKESIIIKIKSCTQFWCDRHGVTKHYMNGNKL